MASTLTDTAQRIVEGMTPTEDVLWRIVRGAEALKAAVEHWQNCQRRSASLLRHTRRCSLVATAIHRASAYTTTLGAAAKVVGGVTTAVGVVSGVPSLRSLGSRVWKAGCAAKLAGLGGRVVVEVWERGLRDTLTSYLSHLSGFLQSVTLVRSVLEDIGGVMATELAGGNSNEFAWGNLMPLLLLACPQETFPYAAHLVKLCTSPQHYSALYDFTSMAVTSFTGPEAESVPVSILHELESLNVFTALPAMSSLPQPLQVAGTVLHVGRELVDLISSLRTLQSQDAGSNRHTPGGHQPDSNRHTPQGNSLPSSRAVLHKLKTLSTSLSQSVKVLYALKTPERVSRNEHINENVGPNPSNEASSQEIQPGSIRADRNPSYRDLCVFRASETIAESGLIRESANVFPLSLK